MTSTATGRPTPRGHLSALLILALTVGLPAASQAQQVETKEPLPDMAAIEQAWDRADFDFVREGLHRHATETDAPLAFYRYARVLLEGRGGPVDLPGAVEWLEKAVDQHHIAAATLLAQVLLGDHGDALTRDPQKAHRLLQRSAARGAADAQFYLGVLLSGDELGPPDLESAVDWYLASAEQQHAPAEFALYLAYRDGLGVAVDAQRSMDWLSSAASNGYAEAQTTLALALQGDAPEDALRWFAAAAEGGHPYAQRVLGLRLLTGEGAEADPVAGKQLLALAANGGDLPALVRLGLVLATDTYGPADIDQATQILQQAAQRGSGAAMVALARLIQADKIADATLDQAIDLYGAALQSDNAAAARIELGKLAALGALDGKIAPGTAVPWALSAGRAGHDEAMDWLRTQADAGLAEAMDQLGRHLQSTESNHAEAYTLIRQAAELGIVDSQFALAEALSIGLIGDAPDYVAAHQWYNLAAAQGHEKAAETRDLIAALMTAEQIGEAQRAARLWFEVHNRRALRPASQAVGDNR